MINQTQKQILNSAGIYIEDMGSVWGKDFEGQYRWMNKDNDDFGEIEYSEEDAWAAAFRQL